MRWGVYVAHMGEIRNVYKIFDGKDEGKRPLGRPTKRLIILKWILWEQVWECGLNSSDSGQGLVVGSCEHSNEPAVS